MAPPKITVDARCLESYPGLCDADEKWFATFAAKMKDAKVKREHLGERGLEYPKHPLELKRRLGQLSEVDLTYEAICQLRLNEHGPRDIIWKTQGITKEEILEKRMPRLRYTIAHAETRKRSRGPHRCCDTLHKRLSPAVNPLHFPGVKNSIRLTSICSMYCPM